MAADRPVPPARGRLRPPSTRQLTALVAVLLGLLLLTAAAGWLLAVRQPRMEPVVVPTAAQA